MTSQKSWSELCRAVCKASRTIQRHCALTNTYTFMNTSYGLVSTLSHGTLITQRAFLIASLASTSLSPIFSPSVRSSPGT